MKTQNKLHLEAVPRKENLSSHEFFTQYAKPNRPVVLKDFAKDWPALKKWSPEYFEETYGESAKVLYQKGIDNDTSALSAFKAYGVHLGIAIKAILYLYAPECIILGGSISNAYPFFKASLDDALNSFAYQKQLQNFKIETSDLVDSPILGAAALCL